MNELGKLFLAECRSIIEECSKLETPERAARVAVFAMCVMLDGSGEHVGLNCRVAQAVSERDDIYQLAEFFHHDL